MDIGNAEGQHLPRFMLEMNFGLNIYCYLILHPGKQVLIVIRIFRTRVKSCIIYRYRSRNLRHQHPYTHTK